MRFKILIVEDDEAIRETVKGYLESVYIVKTVKTATEAVKVLKDQTFHGLILDLNLPDAHGTKIVKFMKEKLNKTAILILTGDKTEKAVQQAKDIGADNYLVKPVDKERLHDKLKKAIFKKLYKKET